MEALGTVFLTFAALETGLEIECFSRSFGDLVEQLKSSFRLGESHPDDFLGYSKITPERDTENDVENRGFNEDLF